MDEFKQSNASLCEMLRAMGHGTHDDLSLAFEAAAEIERLRVALRAVDDLLKIIEHDDMLASDARDVIRAAIDEQFTPETGK